MPKELSKGVRIRDCVPFNIYPLRATGPKDRTSPYRPALGRGNGGLFQGSPLVQNQPNGPTRLWSSPLLPLHTRWSPLAHRPLHPTTRFWL